MLKKDKNEKNNIAKDNVQVEQTLNPADINVEVAYKNEQVVENGTILTKNTNDINIESLVTVSINRENGEPLKYVYESSTNFNDASTSIIKLKNYYCDSGNSIDKTYDYLIGEIKANPKNVSNLIANLCGSIVSTLYDHEYGHEDFGDAKNTLEAMLRCKDEEELKGLICMGIHEFGMQLLHECNIPAVVLCGAVDWESNGIKNHATLLYQRPDGKFVYNDYELPQKKNKLYYLHKCYKKMFLFYY